ncbi:MAG: DoxX family membrane protein [Chloroflexi bacterium]|nr:DoxX family membrane protein [Chloroflexota bacterium]
MVNLISGDSVVEFSLILRFILGLTLTFAGTGKLHHLSHFVAGVLRYQILPTHLARWYGRLLPIAEIGVGVLLLIGIWTRPAAIISTAMFVSFAIAVGINLAYKRKMPCFCFGADSSNIGWHTTVRISLLFIISLLIAITPYGGDALRDYLYNPSIDGLIGLLPIILLTIFGLLVLSIIEISPLVMRAWTVMARRPANQGYNIVWIRESKVGDD